MEKGINLFQKRCNKIVDNKNRQCYIEHVKDVINKITTKIYQKSLQSFDKTEKVKFRKTQSKKSKKNSVERKASSERKESWQRSQ